MFPTWTLYVIKDLVTVRKTVPYFAKKVIVLTSAFFLSLIYPKYTRRSAACQYTQEYMKTFYFFYSHAFWWTLKGFLPGTFSHWIEFHYTGLHWIVMDALEKNNNNTNSSHTFSGHSRGAFNVLLPLLVTNNAMVLCDSSKQMRPAPLCLQSFKYHIPVMKVFYNMPSVHHSNTSFSINLRWHIHFSVTDCGPSLPKISFLLFYGTLWFVPSKDWLVTNFPQNFRE